MKAYQWRNGEISAINIMAKEKWRKSANHNGRHRQHRANGSGAQ
jgi:hypothetical protein